ncbi:hypothetical protein GCM10009661_53530 [Catellatospora chokoriensis]|uniref:RNA polymerase sigma-70 factor (Sigma-E family) n=1 Tax=Catellatospora chokoriensis TaxID=310353 RepID=A0A8J3K344_9ACTN|nr:hypothetical protein Cch02nite_50110 [Catellatospora chokoriensis]
MNRYEGFQEFVVARGGALSRTAFLLTGEHHAAEDLVQSALAKAATRWRQIRDGGQPEAYVRRIMINEQISWWRRRPARPVAEVPDRAGPDSGQRVLDRMVLDRALDQLSPRQRATVVLRFYEDLSEADTASALDCSVGAVKRYTHDALARLRESLPMLAEHAGQYADAGAAVAKAKRRRTSRIAATAAASLALVAAVLAVLVPGSSGSGPVPPLNTPSPSPSPYVPSEPAPLPVGLTDRSAQAQPLPRDRAIGRAMLLLEVHEGGDGYIVAVDGTWWRSPKADSGAYTLSPDGRWLARKDKDRVVVRDLTGTTEHALPAATGLMWAPSGGWLYGMNQHGAGWLVSPGTWSPREVAEDRGSVLAVTDAGELLCTDVGTGRTRLTLRIVSPATGGVRHIAVDTAAQLGVNERLAQVPVADVLGGFVTEIEAAAGGIAAVEFLRHDPRQDWVRQATGIIEFSLADGRVLRRVDLIGEDGRQGDVLCYRDGGMLWTDRRTLHGVRAGTTKPYAIMPLSYPQWVYEFAGCGAIAVPARHR